MSRRKRPAGKAAAPTPPGYHPPEIQETVDKDGNKIVDITFSDGSRQTTRNFAGGGRVQKTVDKNGTRIVDTISPDGRRTVETIPSGVVWRFRDSLGTTINVREFPADEEGPAVRSVTSGIADLAAPDAKAREVAASLLAADILREYERADAEKKRRETNAENARKKQKKVPSDNDLRERWRRDSKDDPHLTFYKFSVSQDDCKRSTVERAIPKKLRH